MTAKRAHPTTLRRMLFGMLFVVCTLRQANARDVAPSFTAKTLSGETFTNQSVRGSVVLLQFWTTWCPVCREDQPAVESIGSEFAAQGLVVLAVDVHEPEATVRQYLRERPRSSPIVLTQDTDLVAKYKPHSFPLYVVLDREGNVAGTQNGGGGEESLRHVLRRAGLTSGPAEPTEKRAENPPPGRTAAAGKMIVLQGTQPAYVLRRTPQAPAVFVLSTGDGWRRVSTS